MRKLKAFQGNALSREQLKKVLGGVTGSGSFMKLKIVIIICCINALNPLFAQEFHLKIDAPKTEKSSSIAFFLFNNGVPPNSNRY